jgi:hypothetical protein
VNCAMKRLILTSGDSAAGALKGAGLADCVLPLEPRFVWGSLPSPNELERRLAPRSATDDACGSHWLNDLRGAPIEEAQSRGLGLVEFCASFDAIELWIDPEPNAQLVLIWLLGYFRPHASIVSKLNLVQADVPIGSRASEELAAWRIPAIKIRNEHLEIARSAWQAYRAPTPRAWFDLLAVDLSALPWLRPAVVMLLEELPMPGSGLGATEMRMLELIAEDNACPPDVFPVMRSATSGVCSAIGKLARCWTVWRVVRRPLCRAWMRGLSHRKCTTIVIATHGTNKAGCH